MQAVCVYPEERRFRADDRQDCIDDAYRPGIRCQNKPSQLCLLLVVDSPHYHNGGAVYRAEIVRRAPKTQEWAVLPWNEEKMYCLSPAGLQEGTMFSFKK